MWASAVVFFLYAHVVGATKPKPLICGDMVRTECHALCEGENFELKDACDACDVLIEQANHISRPSLRQIHRHNPSSASAGKEPRVTAQVKITIENAVKDAKKKCVEEGSTNKDSRYIDENTTRNIRRLLEALIAPRQRNIKKAVVRCESEVATFCVNSKMCEVFCEKSESHRGNENNCINQCTKNDRCRPKPPGPSSLVNKNSTDLIGYAIPSTSNTDIQSKTDEIQKEKENEDHKIEEFTRKWIKGDISGTDNLALDIQTSSQLMQCIAEKREELGKERTTGRREVRWQFIQTRPLRLMGVFADKRMVNYFTESNLKVTQGEIEELGKRQMN